MSNSFSESEVIDVLSLSKNVYFLIDFRENNGEG